MSRARKLALPLMAMISIALCVAAIALWICSHHWPWHISFRTSQARYTLHSSNGDLVFAAPPPGNETDTPQIEALAQRMSVADLEPQDASRASTSSYYLPRTGTPTETLLDQYLKIRRADGHWAEKFAIHRAMLRRLEDSRQFLPAMCVLYWGLHDYSDPDQGTPAQVYGKPPADLPIRPEDWNGSSEQLREYWHDWFDVRILRMCYAWLVAATLVLPIAWITKPRRASQSARRWALNAVSFLSLLLNVATTFVWTQSYRGGFQLRSLFPVHRGDDYMDYATMLNSWNGSFHFYFVKKNMGIEYGPQEETVLDVPDFMHYDAGWIARGEYGSAQNDNQSPEPAWYGAVTVRYWLLVLASSVLPVYWLARCRHVTYRPGACKRCGYDLRATPLRCPECGCIPA